MNSDSIHAIPESRYLNCIRCGLCLAVCPTYRLHLCETASPRGRVALARKGLEGELELSRNLIGQMYACFNCLACSDLCPVGIHPADLAVEMRSLEEQHHPKQWKRLLFGGLTPHPRRLERTTWPLRVYEHSGFRSLVYQLGLRRWLPAQLRDMEAMLPHLPRRPLRRSLPEISAADGDPRLRVGFFLGCAQNLMFAQESAATVRVLNRNGCTVITPKETACCGMPALAYGRADAVREQARRNIELFERAGVEYIVTDCATCGSTLKDYGRLLAGDAGWEERAHGFSSKVRDISEFLMDISPQKPAGRIDARVTYHDPCHLRRGQGVWIQPRDLLRMIDGLEVVEMQEADWCCGSAGSQLITHYETSYRTLKKKMDNIVTTAADLIATGCPGCRMQLNVGVRRQQLQMQVVHPVALLDMAYRGENPLLKRNKRDLRRIRGKKGPGTGIGAGIEGATGLCRMEEGD